MPRVARDPKRAEKIGASIRSHRKHRGLSTPQLAKKVKIDRVSLTRIELGQALPDVETLEKLARVLKTNVGSFLRGVLKPLKKEIEHENVSEGTDDPVLDDGVDEGDGHRDVPERSKRRRAYEGPRIDLGDSGQTVDS